jgi:hypothetical protein
MKMTVVVNKSGKVISTYLHPKRLGKNDPIFGISGGARDTVHELDVPAELGNIESTEELHLRVGEYLNQRVPKKSPR